jgi:hypothetical protein
MLYYRLTMDDTTTLEAQFKTDMGFDGAYSLKASLLPNLQLVEDREFWSWMTSHSCKAQIYLDGDKFVRKDTGNLAWARVKLFWFDIAGLNKQGYLAAVFNDYTSPLTQFYKFGPCDHDWREHSPRMCYHVVTCVKCKATYDYHSD